MLRCAFDWLLVGVLVSPVAAGQEMLVLDLDPEQSTVQFQLGATLHTVHGDLGPASGRIAFDAQTGLASGEVVIDLTGAETGAPRRDQKMHDKILETDRFPQAVYRVERIDLPGALVQGSNDLQLHGTLTLHGVTHRVALPAIADLQGDRVSATAWLDVPYVDWGLEDPSFFLLRVTKSVRVEITAVGRIEGEIPTSPAQAPAAPETP